MRLVIITDCWLPQIDGIVITLQATIRELQAMGHDVTVLTPQDFPSLPLPYGDRLVLPWYPSLARRIAALQPDSVHLATQGLLALAGLMACRRNRWHYTTAYHTRFPEYAQVRFGLPTSLLYRYARWFHGASAPTLVPSRALADDLRARGIGRPELWSRGVDTRSFHPRPKSWSHFPRPIHLYVGRVVAEKNIDAFLDLSLPGTRLVVGSGPSLPNLQRRHPEVVFLGELRGDALAQCYCEADVFVFPSKLDTFGLVVLEALASGTPVAAFPSPYLTEIFGNSGAVVFDDDLTLAIERARQISPSDCRAAAERYGWRACTERFVGIIDRDLRTNESRLSPSA